MKRLRRRLLIVLILGGILYGGYFFLIRPTGFTSQEELASTFFEQMNTSDACETYFNPETESFCATFITLFDGEQLVVESTTETADGVTVVVSHNGTTATFEVTYIEESITGLRGVFHNRYYLIDTIQ
jgi:hypothetical protein